jgi:hypothetical protein
MENYGEMIWTGRTPYLSNKALCKFYQQTSSSKEEEEQANKIMNFALQSISYLPRGFFNIFRHGFHGFSSPCKGRRAADLYRPYNAIALGRV